jgi:hypothetical protein
MGERVANANARPGGVRLLGVSQPGCVGTMGVHRIRGEKDALRIMIGERAAKGADLVGLVSTCCCATTAAATWTVAVNGWTARPCSNSHVPTSASRLAASIPRERTTKRVGVRRDKLVVRRSTVVRVSRGSISSYGLKWCVFRSVGSPGTRCRTDLRRLSGPGITI